MNKLASPSISRSMAIAASAAAFVSPSIGIAEAQEPVAPQAPTPVLTEFDVERCQNVMLGSGVFSLELKGKVGSRVIKLTSEFDAPAPISYADGTQTVDCTKITLTKYEVQPVQRTTKKVKTSSGAKSKNRIRDVGNVNSLIADSAKGYNPSSENPVTKIKNARLKKSLTKAQTKKRTFGYLPITTSIPRGEAIRAINPNINVAALKERTKRSAIKWVGSKAIQKTGSGSQDPNKVIYPSHPPQPLDQAGQEAMLRKCNLMVGLNADAPGGKQDGSTKYMKAQVELDASGQEKHNYTFRTFNETGWCGGVIITKSGVRLSFEPDSRTTRGGNIKDKAGGNAPDGYEQVIFLGKNDELPYSGLLSSSAYFTAGDGGILSWQAQQ